MTDFLQKSRHASLGVKMGKENMLRKGGARADDCNTRVVNVFPGAP